MNKLILFFIFCLFSCIQVAKVHADACPTGFKRPSYKTRSFYCSAGEFVKDYYNGNKLIACKDMEVDHLIPLKVAHCAGLSEDALKRLANDPDNLRYTTMKTNRSKGAKSLDDFALTLSPHNREKVLRDGIRVMERYQIPTSRLVKRELAHLTQLRIQKRLIRKQIFSISRRATTRILQSTTRNAALSKPQAATGILAPLALAMIAWDLYDACRMLEDISELEEIANNALTDNNITGDDTRNKTLDFSPKVIDKKSCGMTRSELVSKITGKDPKFEACVVARLNTNLIDPSECDGFEFATPNFEGEKLSGSSDVKVPTFD
jgi:hypothetical protein